MSKSGYVYRNVCEICGKQIRCPASHTHAEKKCLSCGKMFEKSKNESIYTWENKKYCCNKCIGIANSKRLTGLTGKKNYNWRGGKYKRWDGYIYIRKIDHPNCSKMGYVFEHRLVMEKHLGRFLKKTERIHHINGNRQDNRLKNLKLFSSDSEHSKFHYKKGDFKIH